MKARLASKYLPLDDYEIVNVGNYVDGSPRIEIQKNGERYAVASVCLINNAPRPEKGHIWVKDWSENEGVYRALLAAGIVEEATVTTTVGPFDCRTFHCKLNDELLVQG